MEKFARKHSDDPVQEALRTHKDKWNIAAKEFIARVIAYKRALNGRGDQKYSLPPGKIQDPLPQNVGAFLNEIASNFEQLVGEAMKIQDEQAAYSKTRKQPQPPGQLAPIPAPAGEAAPKTASNRSSTLIIGAHVVPTLLAVSAEEQEKGLMGREWPPPVMAFVYSEPSINRFWMKNTPSPLDIVFALRGEIVAIHKGEPHSTALIGEMKFSDLVVELPFGTCKKLGIKVGDPVTLANSSNLFKK